MGAKTAADAAELIRSKYGLNTKDQFFELNTNKWKFFDSDQLTKKLSNYKLLENKIEQKATRKKQNGAKTMRKYLKWSTTNQERPVKV